MRIARIILNLIILFCFFSEELTAQSSQPNIILLVADDLNDFPGFSGGHPQSSTPNLDQLARDGFVFENAFCNAPVCAASRASFLTGKSPVYTRQYTNQLVVDSGRIFRRNFDTAYGNGTVYTIPELLKDSGGYYTLGINKIFHGWSEKLHDNDFDSDNPDPCSRDKSWSNFYDWHPNQDPDLAGFPDYGQGTAKSSYGALTNAQEEDMIDIKVTDSAVQFIADYAANPADFCNRPFFMAVGHRRPHGPHFVPEKYFLPGYNSCWDFTGFPYNIPYNVPSELWPPNGVVPQPQPPAGFGSDLDSLPLPLQNVIYWARTDSGFIKHVDELASIPFPDPTLDSLENRDMLINAKRAGMLMAYLAAVQFYDTQIGKIIEELNEHPTIRDNTIIIFLSDHGFSQGEKKHWVKVTPWETEMRIPFFIVDPRKPGGKTVKKPITLLDLFPTILDFAGVEHPDFPDGSGYLDGESLTGALVGEELANKAALLSLRVEKDVAEGSCYVHHAVRDQQFRYVRFRSNGTTDCTPGTDSIYNLLYHLGHDRAIDPHEWTDISDAPFADLLMKDLARYLPDSALFNSTGHVEIGIDSLPCWPVPGSSLSLFTVPSDTSTTYRYCWETDFGFADSSNFVEVPVPLSAGKFVVNLKMLDSTDQLVASDRIIIRVDTSALPGTSFFVSQVASLPATYSISDYDPGAAVWNTTWDFGDGTKQVGRYPKHHTYTDTGKFVISVAVQYGNDPDNLCVFVKDTVINVNATDLPVCPTVKNQIAQSGASSLKLNWASVFNATAFSIRYKKSGLEDSIWQHSSSTSGSQIVNGLLPNTSYTWQVQSICDTDTSAWSYPTRDITHRCKQPYGFKFSKQDSDVLFVWDQVDYANTGYKIKLQRESTVFLDTLLGPSTNQLLVTDLPHGHYSARLFCMCAEVDSPGFSSGPNGDSVSFIIKAKYLEQFDDEDFNSAEIVLHPNPTSGYLKISWENASDQDWIEIFDLSSRLVNSFPVSAEHGFREMQLNDLPAGIYFVRLSITPHSFQTFVIPGF